MNANSGLEILFLVNGGLVGPVPWRTAGLPFVVSRIVPLHIDAVRTH
jgi:hypothetical protein